MVAEEGVGVALPDVVWARADRGRVFEREARPNPPQGVQPQDIADLVSNTHVRVKPERAVIDLRVETIGGRVGSVADRHVPEKQRSAPTDHELGRTVSEEAVDAQLRSVGIFLRRGRVQSGVERQESQLQTQTAPGGLTDARFHLRGAGGEGSNG